MLKDYVCVDIETNGTSAKWGKIIEIGAVKVNDGRVVDTFSQLINPGIKLSDHIIQLTGITDEMLAGQPTVKEVLPRFIEFAQGYSLLGHNIMFDYGFLKQNAINLNLQFDKEGVDTLKIARKMLKGLESRGLEYLCNYYGIADENHHRAFNDAQVTSQLYLKFIDMFGDEHPELFEAKELVYKVKKLQPITEKQKKYLIDLAKFHNLQFDFDIDALTRNEASKKIDKILAENGRIFG